LVLKDCREDPTQRMPANWLETSRLETLLEVAGNGGTVTDTAGRTCENDVGVLPVVSSQDAIAGFLCATYVEGAERQIGKRESALCTLGLRLRQDPLAVLNVDGVANRYLAVLQIEILPSEGEQLAAAHAGRCGEKHQRLKPASLECGQDLACVLRRDDVWAEARSIALGDLGKAGNFARKPVVEHCRTEGT